MKSPKTNNGPDHRSHAENIKGGEGETQGQIPVQRRENNTGLPDNLKAGIENLSGHSMNDVKVHYNSPQPAQLNAHAYAQGTDIHVAPGQEKHVPHEAWHVVQQKQGRVKANKQLKGKTNINDDAGLEKEADVMGTRALSAQKEPFAQLMHKGIATPTVQRMPSTFLTHTQAAKRLLAGKSEKSKDFRVWVKDLDPWKLFNTKWTNLQDALEAYTNLPDNPVTADHLRLILDVEAKVDAWKLEHNTKQKEQTDELSDDQAAKLLVVKDIENALPDEIQYARTAGRNKPKTEGGIVGSRLEFMFKDALGGEDLIDVHSELFWNDMESRLPQFDKSLLKKAPLENAAAYREISDQKLVWLAFARAKKLGASFDAKTKMTVASAQFNKLSLLAGRNLVFDQEISQFSQRILLEIIDQKVRPSYPDLADEIIDEVKRKDVAGLNIAEFYETAGDSFVKSDRVPNNVKELSGDKLDKLKSDIKGSKEYALFCRLAKAHATPGITGKDLPGGKPPLSKEEGKEKEREGDDEDNIVGEDLDRRENDLLHTLQFEGEVHDKDGNKLKTNLPVSGANKQRVVLAVMTIEKIIGRPLPKYPIFTIIKKPNGYRANADAENRYIRYDENFEMRTAVHELGHYYENQSKLQDWYFIYLLIRSRHRQKARELGKSPDHIYDISLSQVKNEPGFLGGLKGLEHRYYQEYTSKYYRTGHTEMLSMFSERIIDQKRIDSVLEHDPQAFAILMKILRPDALPKWDLRKLGYERV